MSVTFTKLFSSITESTIWCEDSDIRIVWITMLAMCDRHGRVWASIPGLANRAQVSLEMAEKALTKFLSPDQYSRTPEYEGRRIEPIDGGWRLLNHEKYRAIRDEEERKEYKRKWIAEKRAKGKDVDNVDQCRPQYTHTDTDTYTDTYTDTKKGKRKNFKPPSLQELKSLIDEKNYSVNAEDFYNFYESKGWKVGNTKMKSWPHAVAMWHSRNKEKEPEYGAGAK